MQAKLTICLSLLLSLSLGSALHVYAADSNEAPGSVAEQQSMMTAQADSQSYY